MALTVSIGSIDDELPTISTSVLLLTATASLSSYFLGFLVNFIECFIKKALHPIVGFIGTAQFLPSKVFEGHKPASPSI